MVTKIVKSVLVVSAVIFLAAIGISCKGGSGRSSDSKLDSEQSEASVSQPDTLFTEIADWCAEHRVPESECTHCHPQLAAKFKADGDWCGEHNLPESHCRICNPDIVFPQEKSLLESTLREDSGLGISVFFPENSPNCATDGALIQFATSKTVERAGLRIEPVLSAALSPSVEAPAEIIFDETNTTIVTTSIPVLVVRWLVQPGQPIKAGEAIAELESPEMPKLQGDFLEAQANWKVRDQELKRKEELLKQNITSTATYEATLASAQVTQAELAKAEGFLRAAGMSNEELQEVLTKKSVTPRYWLRAPVSGRLMRRDAKLGELLPAGTPLTLISDLSLLWVESKVREQDIKKVEVGQEMEFLTDASGNRRFKGQIIWVAQYLDQDTRTATVRGKILSGSDRLNPGEFGRAIIYTQAANTSAALVPKDAVQWEGCCNVVFVQEAPDRYRPRKVNIDTGEAGYYRVTEGVRPGELVVVHGSYLLKTELKKESIGAGCCEAIPSS
jgi:cobalt-zinc-cadmium efflux system membrane fusion protein